VTQLLFYKKYVLAQVVTTNKFDSIGPAVIVVVDTVDKATTGGAHDIYGASLVLPEVTV